MTVDLPPLTRSQRLALRGVVNASVLAAHKDAPNVRAVERFLREMALATMGEPVGPRPRPTPRTEFETTLYRHFDAAGRLLYVGIAFDERSRRKAHGRLADWFEFSASVTHELFEDRAGAEAAERRAIADERPVFNVAQRDKAGRARLVQYLVAVDRLDLLAGRMR